MPYLKFLSSTNHHSPQLRLASTTSCASSILKETLNGSFLIHGAKFEQLGLRKPELYGTTSLSELTDILQVDAFDLVIDLDSQVTNIEGEAITWIYDGREGVLTSS